MFFSHHIQVLKATDTPVVGGSPGSKTLEDVDEKEQQNYGKNDFQQTS
jgi:hypothetical protein